MTDIKDLGKKKEEAINKLELEKNEFIKGIEQHLIPFFTRLKYELTSPSLYLMVFAFISGILLCAGHLKSGAAVLFFTFITAKRLKAKTREKNIENCLKSICEDPEKTREFQLLVNAPQAMQYTKDKEERTEWINDIVYRIWPFYNGMVQNEIDKKGYTDANKGMDIGGGHIIHFERFTLGDKPPVITHIGINRASTRTDDELVLEMKVLYFGNCLLSFTKKALGCLRIKAGVKDIYFRGNGRLVMRPLIKEPPFFGGCSFCLLDRPIIDYDGINLGNLADNKLFKNFLISIVEGMIVSPNKLYFPFSEEPEIKRQLKFAPPIGVCYFEIIEAENLPRADASKILTLTGLSDPFCIARVGSTQFETPVVFNSLNPYWGENHSVPIHDVYDLFKIDIYDKDALSADDFIGSVEFQLKDIINETHLNGLDKWLPLGKCSSGAIHFRVACFNLVKNAANLTQTREQIEKSKHKFPVGIFSVYVYSLRLSSRTDKTTVPVIQLKYSGQSYQTQPAVTDKPNAKTLIFNIEESFHFIFNNPDQDVLEITVVDASGMNFSKLTRVDSLWDEIIGTCGIHMDTILKDASGLLVQNKNIDLVKGKDSRGLIKLYLCLQIVQINSNVYDNLQIATDVKCRVDQPTSETSFLRRLIMQPANSLRHPIKTLGTLRNTTFSFSSQKPISVVDDLSPAPPNIDNNCHIKIRMKWPERSSLFIEILKVVNIPSVYSDPKYKFSVSIKLGQENTRTSVRAAFRKYLATQKTHKYSYPTAEKQKEPGSVIMNERLVFKIDATQYIENYETHIILKSHLQRNTCMMCCSESTVVASALERIPHISFRGDPIERWFKLTGLEPAMRIERQQIEDTQKLPKEDEKANTESEKNREKSKSKSKSKSHPKISGVTDEEMKQESEGMEDEDQ